MSSITPAPARSHLLAVCAAVGIVLLGWLVGGVGAIVFIRFGPEVVFHEDFAFYSDVVVYTVTALFTAWAALLSARLLRRGGRGPVTAAAAAVLLTVLTNALLNAPFLATAEDDDTGAVWVVLGASLAGALLGAVAGVLRPGRGGGTGGR